jgi:hypothetical protein
MRNLLVLGLLFFFTGFSICSAQSKTNSGVKTVDALKLHVYYFHATNRCPTCLSIENNTKKVLETYYKKELESGVIKFSVLNSDDDENKAVCKKYEAFGSALHLVKIVKGKETDTDMTNFAFSYSYNDPDKFLNGLKDKINELLK